MGTTKQYHIQGKKGSLFRNQMRGVILEQVLIVAIDAAKLHQKALICNYFGDVIEKPFFSNLTILYLYLLEPCTSSIIFKRAYIFKEELKWDLKTKL
jgi:hypothetical protein